MARTGQYASDRWVTPGVLVALIVGATLILVTVTGGVAYLTARGIDPDPMIRLVATFATGLIAAINLLVNLAGRTTAAKTERNTGVLATHTEVLANAVAEATAAPQPAPTLPAVNEAYAGEDHRATEEQRLPVPPLPPYPSHAARIAR